MSNDIRSSFGKHAAKAAKPNADVKEVSLSNRMTKFRAGEPDGTENLNPFERAAARQEPAPIVVQKASAPRTRAGVAETPELTAARAAEEQRRAGIKAEAAKPQYRIPDPKTLEAIVVGWLTEHSDPRKANYFERTEWNMNQLVRGVKMNAEAGRCGWDYPGFEAVFNLLKDRGGLESSSRHRGTSPPMEVFPEFTPVPAPDTNATVKTRTVMTHEEAAALRSMDFDSLRESVQSGYKK